MKSTSLQKRSIRISGVRTSLALEDAFWNVLDKAARRTKRSLPVLLADIDNVRRQLDQGSLASAARVYALQEAAEHGL